MFDVTSDGLCLTLSSLVEISADDIFYLSQKIGFDI